MSPRDPSNPGSPGNPKLRAWFYGSVAVLAYAVAMAVTFHIFIISYEERTLRRRFGPAYLEYRRTVSRWLVRPPSHPRSG
jgi:protein-S-isoprenylcysteine O-methyltransferase Ste14